MLTLLAYISAIVTANITAGWVLPSISGITTTVGTLLFGATFTLRDRLHRYGRRRVYLAIASAVVLTALIALFTGAGWRILGASVVALAIAESADTEIFHRIPGGWWRRALGSNAVSVPLDTALFNVLAFGGAWTWPLLLSVSIGDIVVKYATASGVALWRQHSSTAPERINASSR